MMSSTAGDAILANKLGGLRIDGEPEKVDPFRHVIRKHHHARDITNEFTKAAKVLKIGQLVKDDSFSLFESVQSLEIMDPKMDSGMLAPGETLDDTFTISHSLLPIEILAIMDQLLCYEMSWHQGYPLAQNIFTSHHIDHLLSQSRQPHAIPTFRHATSGPENEPDVLVEGVLKAYCMGVIKCCDIVVETIVGQQYYEEEDFNTNTFNRKLLVDIDDDACIKLLDRAVEYLQSEATLDSDVRAALITRLQMRKSLILTFLPNESILYGPNDWSRLTQSVSDLLSTHPLAKPIPEAFSAKLQRRLASTQPPRPIIDVKFEEACQQLKALYVDLEEVLRLGKIWTDDANFPIANLMTTSLTFCNRPSQPSALSRALLQALLLADGRLANVPGGNMQALLIDAIRELLPEDTVLSESWWQIEIPGDWRYELAKDIDTFLSEGAPVMEGVLRSLCQNPCRIRRCLVNALEDVDTWCSRIQTRFSLSAEPPFDSKINPLDLATPGDIKSSAVASLIHNAMFQLARNLEYQMLSWVISLGFSQDIYLPHELSSMYSCLSTTTHMHISSLTAHTNFLRTLHASLPKPRARRIEPRFQIHELRILVLRSEQNFADGLAGLYTLLDQQQNGHAPATTRSQSPYIRTSLQTELRMKPFLGLQFASATATAITALSASIDQAQTLVTQIRTSFVSVRTAYKSLIHSDPSSSTPSATHTSAVDYQRSAALGSLGRGQAWKTEVQGNMRACIAAELVLRRLESAGDTEKLKWRVEGLEEREAKGVGRWIVPVVGDV